MKPGPSVLFFDSENAPNVAATWGIHEQRLRYQDLIEEWFFLSIQFSWDNSPKVNAVSILDDKERFKKDHTDDYHVVKTAHTVIGEADIIVGHNIKGHDLKKLNARIIKHKLPPLKPVQIVDTYEWSKRFGFTSRKLGDLCKHLGLTEKLEHEPGIFLKAAMGDIPSIKEIVKYGKGDIPTVRDLYHELRPHAHYHPNVNLFRGDGVTCCPKCNSTEFTLAGFRRTTVGKMQRFQCDECGSYFSSGKSVQRAEMR